MAAREPTRYSLKSIIRGAVALIFLTAAGLTVATAPRKNRLGLSADAGMGAPAGNGRWMTFTVGLRIWHGPLLYVMTGYGHVVAGPRDLSGLRLTRFGANAHWITIDPSGALAEPTPGNFGFQCAGFRRSVRNIEIGGTARADFLSRSVQLRAPAWFASAVACVVPAMWIVGLVRFARREADGDCLSCGYDLQGGHVACPECGKTPWRPRPVREDIATVAGAIDRWARWASALIKTASIAASTLALCVVVAMWATSYVVREEWSRTCDYIMISQWTDLWWATHPLPDQKISKSLIAVSSTNGVINICSRCTYLDRKFFERFARLSGSRFEAVRRTRFVACGRQEDATMIPPGGTKIRACGILFTMETRPTTFRVIDPTPVGDSDPPVPRAAPGMLHTEVVSVQYWFLAAIALLHPTMSLADKILWKRGRSKGGCKGFIGGIH